MAGEAVRTLTDDEKAAAQALLSRARAARAAVSHYDQAAVDQLCRVLAWATANEQSFGRLTRMSVAESGMGSLIRATYHLLGLQTYFTAGEKEVRAWTIHHGDTAPQAAGAIHSDFERGFIKAETVDYNDLIECGSVAAARAKGLYRMEGKEYVVADGDVMLFKFAV